MKIINAIVASDKNNGIGFYKGGLPWQLEGEFQVSFVF